jgi:hypothetical protein
VVRSIKVGVVEKKMKWLRSDFIAGDAKTSSEVTCDVTASAITCKFTCVNVLRRCLVLRYHRSYPSSNTLRSCFSHAQCRRGEARFARCSPRRSIQSHNADGLGRHDVEE